MIKRIGVTINVGVTAYASVGGVAACFASRISYVRFVNVFAYNIGIIVLDGVIAICYFVSEGCAIVCIVNGVVVYELTTVNVDFAKVFGINSFVDVENVPFTFELLCSFELAAVNVNGTVSCGENNCTVGSRVIITAIDVYNCAIGRGYNRVGSAARATLHRALTVNGNYGSGTLCPKNFNNAVFVNPISGNGVAAKVNDNFFAFNFNCACEFNVSGQDHVVACLENFLDVVLGCNLDTVFICFNSLSCFYASAGVNVVEHTVNEFVFLDFGMAGCGDFYVRSIFALFASLVSFPTLIGASGSLCFVVDVCVTGSRDFFSS